MPDESPLLTIPDLSRALLKRRIDAKTTNSAFTESFFHNMFGSAKCVLLQLIYTYTNTSPVLQRCWLSSVVESLTWDPCSSKNVSPRIGSLEFFLGLGLLWWSSMGRFFQLKRVRRWRRRRRRRRRQNFDHEQHCEKQIVNLSYLDDKD